jgi:hypothetical protein
MTTDKVAELHKPFQPDDLPQVVSALIEQHHQVLIDQHAVTRPLIR